MIEETEAKNLLKFVRGLRNTQRHSHFYNELWVESLFESLLKGGSKGIGRKSAWLAARMLECGVYKKKVSYERLGMGELLARLYGEYKPLQRLVEEWWYHYNGMYCDDIAIADGQRKSRARVVKRAYRWIDRGERKSEND